MMCRLRFTQLVFIQFHLVALAIAQPDFFYHFCIDTYGNYSVDSEYRMNLLAIFYNISDAQIQYGFYNSSAGSGRDQANVKGLCRGGIAAGDCRSCLSNGSFKLQQNCPNQMEAIGWYDTCMLRYSNRSLSEAEYLPGFYAWNYNNISDVDQFNQVLDGLLDSLRNKASSGDTHLKFASGEANISSFSTIYALTQCTPDLLLLECYTCLGRAIDDIPKCCHGKQGGRVFNPSCNLRYELYPFYKLASPVPTNNSSSNTTHTGEDKKRKRKRQSYLKEILAIPAVLALLVLLISIGWFCKRKHKTNEMSYENIEDIAPVESLQFSFNKIKVATTNFSDDKKLGRGGFGEVYRGRLETGREIAVKRLSKNSGQGVAEFKTEIVIVAKLQHRNLVKLLGFCLSGMEKLLIYEFLPNSSLDKYLSDPKKRASLDWETRFKIICGIARGLQYLHEDSRLRIIHRDLKSSNILLDEAMNPKISDFGLARLFGVDQTQDDTNRIVGTYGYMAPEYAITGNFSAKSDAYSYGVIVLELVSGQLNRFFNRLTSEEPLLERAWRLWNEEAVSKYVDATLGRDYSLEEVIKCIQIGLLCVQEDPARRPKMSLIVAAINGESITLPKPTAPHFLNNEGTTSIEDTVNKECQNGIEGGPPHLYTGSNYITDLNPR